MGEITIKFTNLIEYKHYVQELIEHRKLVFIQNEKQLSVSFTMRCHPATQHKIIDAIRNMADENQ